MNLVHEYLSSRIFRNVITYRRAARAVVGDISWLNSYRASLRCEMAAQRGTGLPPVMWHGGGGSQKLDYGKHEADRGYRRRL